MNNFQEKTSFIWSVADEVLRDDFKRGEYPDVILPFTVLRRLDCVLAPTKDKVLEYDKKLEGKIENKDGALRHASGYSFYNTSPYDFEKLLAAPTSIGQNLRAYINGFSENMREVIDKFKLWGTIDTLEEKGLLFLLIQKFANVDLHPDAVSNHEMGYIFEELIRKFNEQTNENPGEHFTPREVIRLMVNLLLSQDQEKLAQNHIVRTVYDPACGTGGMLTIAKEHILDHINPNANIKLFGQEVNDKTFAISKSDMLIKGDDKDADNIKPDSSFSKDGHAVETFDYILSNPPYGKDWKKEEDFIEKEAKKGYEGRFGAGLPRKSDGQLLFVQHMISKMKPLEEGGSRIAIVMNGSPLFTGDAGSGESEIRRWIIEKDWLEAIVALPNQLFYNTGINTYIWIITNRKDEQRRGKVQLINAADFYVKMRKSLGDKRNEISPSQIEEITKLHTDFKENEFVNIFDNEDFGYRKITVERPSRLNFQASSERIARLKEQSAFQNLAVSKKKKDLQEKAREEAEGRKSQEEIINALSGMDASIFYTDRDQFEKALNAALKKAGLTPAAAVKKAIFEALSERDENAETCKDKKGNKEADSQLRDTENVSLKEDIYAYFEREVKPHVPDAWIDETTRDPKDGKVGKVGYDLNFNRYFYKYEPPRSLEDIEADINKLENEILELLRDVAE
ncbi:Type I restriction-modification system, DNA-methyltransferase subunit M [Methanosarcina sp. Kolksee]|uniref:type I restriction-modification system subunit M n=1 Tax=Methanosarcina sp. Kolksee TaxID=1434099 RepID=UPI000615FFF4|nr:class I SAM-dependent DNA methyltransferase [Methanosarcina sp. Kolksee]AKB49194.1 Type I restriction-modification system, DNA-methyltransferase subunit M [Methanosarcina sp. Kolksee]